MSGEMGGAGGMESSGGEISSSPLETSSGYETSETPQELDDSAYDRAYRNDPSELPSNQHEFNETNEDYQRADEASEAQKTEQNNDVGTSEASDTESYDSAYDEAYKKPESKDNDEISDSKDKDATKEVSKLSQQPESVHSEDGVSASENTEAKQGSGESPLGDNASVESQSAADDAEKTAEEDESKQATRGERIQVPERAENATEANASGRMEAQVDKQITDEDAVKLEGDKEGLLEGEKSVDIEAESGSGSFGDAAADKIADDDDTRTELEPNTAELACGNKKLDAEPSVNEDGIDDMSQRNAFETIDGDELTSTDNVETGVDEELDELSFVSDEPESDSVQLERDAFEPINDNITTRKQSKNDKFAIKFEEALNGANSETGPLNLGDEKTGQQNMYAARPFEEVTPSFESASREYQDVLSERYDMLPQDMSDLFNNYNDMLKISEYDTNRAIAYYDPITDDVHLNQEDDLANPLGPGNTYFHECAHQIDSIKGREIGSVNPFSYEWGFHNAIKEDYNAALETIRNRDGCSIDVAKMRLEDELYAHPNESNCVSDLFGGVSHGEVQGPWGHDVSYWADSEFDIKLSTEAFAEISADKCCGQDSHIQFTRQYLPRTYSLYEASIRR